ncbi:MAG: methyl-accepting chemotaxis protein [bacterium]|nr:methyl-accepting chemotaxis protein [bacterium]
MTNQDIEFDTATRAAAKLQLYKDLKSVDRFMLILIWAHLPIMALAIPYVFGTWIFGIAGGLTVVAIATVSYVLLRGRTMLRIINALLLMLISVVFITASLGMLEMHFHIFGAMAFLVFYRDWRVLPGAVLLVALHHGVFNYCQSIGLTVAGLPVMIFNYGDGWDIVVLHATFVIFEASVLVYYCRQFREEYLNQAAGSIKLTELREKDRSGIFNEVQQSSVEMLSSVGDLTGTATSVARNVQSQAATLEEMSATMEELGANLGTSFDATREQAGQIDVLRQSMEMLEMLTESISDKVTGAADTTGRTAEVARSSKRSLDETSSAIHRIAETSQKMLGIITIINEIADRVNLLALNASIEAARAGEAGRGFSVVANEVSRLADRTTGSTQEINELIDQNVREVQSGMQTMKTTVEVLSEVILDIDRVHGLNNELRTSVDEQRRSYQNFHERLNDINQRSQQISSSTQEQQTAINEVLSSLTGINEVTQTYATAADNLTSIADRNDEIANRLRARIESIG